MARVVILPKLGQTMEEGTIVEWLVKEGDAVNRGDILFEVESDKAVLEVESSQKGTLLKILVGADATVPVLTPVAVIGEPGEDISALLGESGGGGAAPGVPEPEAAVETAAAEQEPAAVAPEPAPAGRIVASPRARRLAGEKGVDLARVTGTGPEGRIIEADVQAWLAAQPAATPLAQRLAAREGVALEGITPAGTRVTAGEVAAASRPAAPAAVSVTAAPVAAAGPGEVTPMRGVRAIIAERMATSSQTTAAITIHSEVDATAFVAMRESLRDALRGELGFNVGYNDLLGVIVARCLVEFPYVNVQLTPEGIRQMPSVNLGLAVDSDRGLLVPVVRDAQTLGIREFARTFRELVERARVGKSNPDELTGGTFTITNLGMFGVDMFTPIINLPECAILGVGRIRPVPAVVDGQVVVRQKMWLSLTADHRLVDGGPAARFLQGIARYIEAPYLLLA
ncbi:MAG: 2-oxo acid dehydrogenase subunit E2 [Chloroflexi bacterium]|nr:2-oxo acid dehydrogenase subunit E2 [Chloroflexota bacterium]